ncbi:MAG: uroporphyrinogen-III C-methyltransferase [Thermoplasmata archaeon]|nr:uroporphyrinogen-III C-methyltransferase [Thermoplasmata archaeon]
MVVYIIGAGPGDLELVTLKAKRLIQEADIIIYDKLANPEILAWASPSCEMVYMGKREPGHQHSQTIQVEINDLLKEHGKGKRVVRLKGGDPFIFGRGGEEAEICAENAIPFEIVPGISSAFAVPAYSGIPVSHRDFNSSFAVLTGHESDKDGSQIDWARLPDNIIVLMGVGKISRTAAKLMDNGRAPDTPAAAIHRGTTPRQKTVLTDLKTLKEGGIDLEPPVIFVIGPIAKLHNILSWYEKKLALCKNKTVLLTGVESHQQAQIDTLEQFGMKGVPMPLIEIADESFEIPDLSGYDALVFTSQEGVKKVAEKIELAGFKGKVFSIGPKTRNSLSDMGIEASIGEKFNSEGLADHITGNLEKGSKILALRSSAATPAMKEKLSGLFDYHEIPIYGIKTLQADASLMDRSDVIFVMSSSCARSLGEIDKDALEGKVIVSIGPETSKNISQSHITAQEHAFNGMINAYIDYLWTGLL